MFRRDLTDSIRSFFRASGALEVKTPLLAAASGSDPLLDWFETESFVDGSDAPRRRLFLPTSPEFHMKRLLAAGWGDVWQLTSGFRNGDRGASHLEEFSILEWYRVGWSDERLMDEVLEICALALGK
ncbi:MAG: EF-P lysine aminoacylase GenX, partial [Fibrobacterales bacterium]|nr:EF-P lysine aminoacylase GenX [Fibrobacterales bacterium]